MQKLTVFILASIASPALLAGATAPVASVPEPGALGLFAAAGVALYLVKKFRK
jgi:hypothetical protein